MTSATLPANDLLSRRLLFRYMKPEELARFVECVEVFTYDEGESIIEEDEIHPYLYTVFEGNVSVHVKNTTGKEVYVSTIGEGEVFGEAGIFLNVPRTAHVMSLGATTVVRIHRTELLEFIRRYPSTGIKVLMIIIYSLLRKLRESNQELAFERKSVVSQDEIDSIVADIMSGT